LPRRLALWLQQRGHDLIHTLDLAQYEFIELSRNQVIGNGGSQTVEAVQSFANDLKLAFYRAAKPAVGGVLFKRVSGAPLLDALARFRHVQEELLFLSPHRRAGASLR
jgi:hypothetical protein